MSSKRAPERLLAVLGAMLLAVAALGWALSARTPEPAALARVPPSATQPPIHAAPTAAAPSTATVAPTTQANSHTPAETPAPGSSEPSGDGVDDRHEHPEPVTGEPTPATTTQRTRWEQARAIAVGAATAFARPKPGVSEAQWWKAASAHLSEQAVDAYAVVDPARVPWSRVEGAGVVVPSEAPDQLLMIVDVPVDTGTVRVELTIVEDSIRVAWIGMAGP